MKNIKEKIENIVKHIQTLFFSENEFQIYLATKLAQELGKDYSIELEEKILGKRIDIVISKNNKQCYIETKYKLKNILIKKDGVKCNRNNLTDKTQFEADIKKLRKLKADKKIIVFITTNNKYAKNQLKKYPNLFYKVEEIK